MWCFIPPFSAVITSIGNSVVTLGSDETCVGRFLNYGALGSTIAREMTLAFDENGRASILLSGSKQLQTRKPPVKCIFT